MATAKRKTPRPPREPLRVVLEDIRAQNRAVIEELHTWRDAFKRSLDELRTDLVTRIEALEDAVRQNSREIRKNSEDIRKNSEDIRRLEVDIQRLEVEVRGLKEAASGCADRASLLSLEARIAVLEERLAVGK